MHQDSTLKDNLFYVLKLLKFHNHARKYERFNSYLFSSIRGILLFFIFLSTFNSFSQGTPNPIFFGWENYVGCIEGEEKRSYEESIAAGLCHIVCQGSTVNYYLSGNSLTNTTWTVLGGTILSQTNTTCIVKWSSTIFTGAIGVTTYSPNGIVDFSPICVEIKTAPNAYFGKDGLYVFKLNWTFSKRVFS